MPLMRQSYTVYNLKLVQGIGSDSRFITTALFHQGYKDAQNVLYYNTVPGYEAFLGTKLALK